MLRSNHYDAAFEEFLRQQQIPYVAVNEGRRAQLGDSSLKSLDFVVATPRFGQVLIDVKGRRAPHRPGDVARRWENWVTADDLRSMTEWETVFGQAARAMLVFAYWMAPENPQANMPVMLSFRGRDYGFFGVWMNDYRAAMSVRSPQWETVWLRRQAFEELRFPLEHLAHPPTAGTRC